jgi:hypothetical protein
LPSLGKWQKEKGLRRYPIGQRFFWLWVINLVLLTNIGAMAVEAPQEWIGGINVLFYFFFYPLVFFFNLLWDWVLQINS